MNIKDKVDDAIASFVFDKPDSLFQKGYLAALEWVQKELKEEIEYDTHVEDGR